MSLRLLSKLPDILLRDHPLYPSRRTTPRQRNIHCDLSQYPLRIDQMARAQLGVIALSLVPDQTTVLARHGHAAVCQRRNG